MHSNLINRRNAMSHFLHVSQNLLLKYSHVSQNGCISVTKKLLQSIRKSVISYLKLRTGDFKTIPSKIILAWRVDTGRQRRAMYSILKIRQSWFSILWNASDALHSSVTTSLVMSRISKNLLWLTEYFGIFLLLIDKWRGSRGTQWLCLLTQSSVSDEYH